MQKKIIIIGAGPGGLTSGMILAHRGYDVTILEKADVLAAEMPLYRQVIIHLIQDQLFSIRSLHSMKFLPKQGANQRITWNLSNSIP